MKFGTVDVAPAVSPSKLSECRFEIPIYQRLFVWDEQRIERLLDDLQTAYSGPRHQHYDVGIISVFEHVSGGEKVWDVVDGQQRLTFFTLLGCEFVRCLSDGDDKEGWKRFVCSKDGATRIHYVGRDEEEQLIRNLLKGEEWPTEGGSVALFHKVFARKYDAWGRDKLASWAKYCLDNVDILINELPATYTSYDLNLYFEKINATGKQLTPVEMVKGLWFASEASKWNACLDFDRVYPMEEKRSELESCGAKLIQINDLFGEEFSSVIGDFGTVNQASSEDCQLVMRPEVLLLHALSIYKCKKDNKVGFDIGIAKSDYRQLVQTFKNAGGIDPNEFVNLLVSYRKWLDDNVIYLAKSADGYDYRLRKNDSKSDDEVLGRDDHERKDADRDMIQLQSLLYVMSEESQLWVLNGYMAKIQKGELHAYLIKLLKNFCSNEWSRCLKDDKVDVNSGALKYPAHPRKLLVLLEYALWINRDNFKDIFKIELNADEAESVKQYRFSRNRSIEHMHPQTDTESDSSITALWKDQKDIFGNLALISTGKNSEYGNMSVAAKYDRFQRLVKERRIESIKLLLMYKGCNGKDNEWTPDKANKLGEQMLELIAHFMSTGDIRYLGCVEKERRWCNNSKGKSL